MKQIFAVAFLFCAAFFFSPQKAFSQPVESDFFRQEGIASWYGPEFDGRPTASGEIFNSALLTAAHPSLPFGTVVVVTNLHNGRSVQVRINDRGPFVHARIIDVSRAAAQELDMLITGTAPVVVESVDRITLPQGVRPGGTQAPAVTLAPVAPAQPAENWFSPPPEPQPQFLPPAQTAAPVPIPAQQAAPQQFAPPPQPVAQPQQQFVPPPQPVAQPQQQFVPPPQPVAQPQQQFVPPPQPVAQPQQQFVPPPQPVAQPQQQFVPPPVVAPVAQPPAQFQQTAQPSRAVLTPAITPNPNGTYRLQVGSYRVARNAVGAFERLRDAGLNPAYERSGEFFRVVLAGVPGNQVDFVAQRIWAAGFTEALIRSEN